MRVESGMMVIKATAFGYTILKVTSRTKTTIATSFLNGSYCDSRAGVDNFRVYDDDKGHRVIELQTEIDRMTKEQRELYLSMEKVE